MRITSKGQVTIPIEIRNKMGLQPNTEVDFMIRGDTVHLIKVKSRGQSRGNKLVAQMRGRATVKMTTDEIMALTREKE